MKVEDGKNPAVTFNKDVTVAGGATQTVVFPLSEKALGEFTVTIDNLKAILSVEIF